MSQLEEFQFRKYNGALNALSQTDTMLVLFPFIYNLFN